MTEFDETALLRRELQLATDSLLILREQMQDMEKLIQLMKADNDRLMTKLSITKQTFPNVEFDRLKTSQKI